MFFFLRNIFILRPGLPSLALCRLEWPYHLPAPLLRLSPPILETRDRFLIDAFIDLSCLTLFYVACSDMRRENGQFCLCVGVGGGGG
jgi:hypothetical protein